MARPTLEQRRARHAWTCCEGQPKEYANLAKGLPALLMNSGLLQVMAFLEEKKGRHGELARHLRQWLHQRFDLAVEFPAFMDELMRAEPTRYRQVTSEAFAWLRWLRQMAPARSAGE